MEKNYISQIRRINQLHAYKTIQMHEFIGQKAGFSGTDHKYLSFLIQKGQMTAGELASVSGLTTGAVTGLIDRFEKKNLVKRQFDSSDRRKVYIVPNIQNIMALMEPLYKKYRNRMETLISSFSKNDIKVIESFILASIEIMEEIRTTTK
ncbi:MAG TPA: MarR family transcriptional regulator [Chryseobacterium sp.]|nr:MarR family transcriptional regulator [Chryseobacterium sp.]